MGLFKPAWMSKNEAKALKAIEKEDDQTKLAEAAKYYGSRAVTEAAIAKITDQALLAETVKYWLSDAAKYWPPEGLKAAIAKITDQALLVDVAMGEHGYWAIDQITDQHLLWLVAIKRDSISSEMAVRRITNEEILCNIALSHPHDYTRLMAIWKITDQDVLTRIALSDPFKSAREDAVRKLIDPEVLVHIAYNDSDARVIRAAVENENMTDQTVLAYLAQYNMEFDILQVVIRKLTLQNVLADIAKSDSTKYKVKYADSYNEYDLEAREYREGEVVDLRTWAAEKLTDEALLTDVIKSCSDDGVRLVARTRLKELGKG